MFNTNKLYELIVDTALMSCNNAWKIEQLGIIHEKLNELNKLNSTQQNNIISLTPNQLRTLIEIYAGHLITKYNMDQDKQIMYTLINKKLIKETFTKNYYVTTNKGSNYVKYITNEEDC